MKKTLSLVLVIIFGLHGYAGETFVKPPAAPVYEACKLIDMQNPSGGTYQVQDTACLGRNTQKRYEYTGAIESYNRQISMISADGTTMTQPTAPAYETCAPKDNGCQSRNQSKLVEYNLQISGWQQMQADKASLNQADQAERERLAAQQMTAASATEALQKAQTENAKSASISSSAATLFMGGSIAAGAKYAMSCSAGCQPLYLAASIALGLLSAKSSKQASENNASAAQACTAEAQLASGGVNCGTTSATYDPTAHQPTGADLVPKVFNADGSCNTTPSICSGIIASLPDGTNIKDITKNASQFAGAFKFNKDGSVTTKDGKTIRDTDLKSAAALQAAGFTPEQAQMALSTMSKAILAAPESGLANAAADLKNTKGNSSDFTGVAMDGGAAGASGKESALGSASGGALSSKGIDGSSGKNARNPAAQGLTRDFNGESIGAAGDDIFSMMNRRYKMKTAQDTFLNK